jgi:uncharacterized LabA/DUF88 family protein
VNYGKRLLGVFSFRQLIIHRQRFEKNLISGLWNSSPRGENRCIFLLLLPTVLRDWWGFFIRPYVDKVGIFLDYENIHRTGHELFSHANLKKYESVVNPITLAETIIRKRKRSSILAEIQVFRGRPVPAFEHKSASANDRQASEWLKDSRVQLIRRDLKYEIDRKLGRFQAREKGIDVALAIALVESAILGKFESAIVFSSDTDLLPAIELVYKRTKCHLEIACWKGARPLWFPELLQMDPRIYSPYCHFLDAGDFDSCRDR